MAKAPERDGVFQRKDRGGWWVSYVDADGMRRKKKVVASTRTQAMEVLRNIKSKEQNEEILGIKPPSDIATSELLKRYKRHQKTRLQPSTFERLGGILKVLEDNLHERARNITKLNVADYISRRSESVKPGTITKEINVLKHCLTLAVEWELLPKNVATGVRLPKMPPGRTKYLTPSELKSVLEIAPDWMRAPIAFAACTGVRRGEMLALRWKDVDVPNRRLYLRETKKGHLRILPIPEVALGVLTSLVPAGGMQPGELVFAGVDPKKLSVYTKRLFAKLKIPDASFHTLRHAAASWLVMEGVDLYAVGQIQGHKTPRMTKRYAHLSPDYMAASVGKLDGVFGGMMPEGKKPGDQNWPLSSPQSPRVSTGS